MGEAPTCYLSTPQAAAVLGLSPRTLECYRVTGGGPPFLTYCNRVHYLRSDLDAWAVSGRRRSTSDDGGASDGRRKRAGGVARANGIAGTGRGPKASPPKTEAEASASEDAILPGAESGTASGHLSVDELAALLQVSRRTLDRYRAKGIGPAFEKVDRRVRYARAGVEAWLASGRRGSISDGDDAAPGSASDAYSPQPASGIGEARQ